MLHNIELELRFDCINGKASVRLDHDIHGGSAISASADSLADALIDMGTLLKKGVVNKDDIWKASLIKRGSTPILLEDLERSAFAIVNAANSSVDDPKSAQWYYVRNFMEDFKETNGLTVHKNGEAMMSEVIARNKLLNDILDAIAKHLEREFERRIDEQKKPPALTCSSPMVAEGVFLRCYIKPCAFSGEKCVGLVCADRSIYEIITPTHRCWNKDGTSMESNPPNETVHGRVQVTFLGEVPVGEAPQPSSFVQIMDSLERKPHRLAIANHLIDRGFLSIMRTKGQI